MALSIYDPATGTFVASTGAGLSSVAQEINILIELRVANLIAVELANGNTAINPAMLRQDIVNEL